MRCKVPAAHGPAACEPHTLLRRPEVTPAAHADRMLQTPPDIATRSQSAGRGVNRPAALLRRPPGGHQPSWTGLPPPEHPGGLAASTHLGSASPRGTGPGPPPRPPGGLQTRGLPGAASGFLPTTLGKCLASHSALWEARFSSEANAGGPAPRLKQMPKCPTSHSPAHQAGGHPGSRDLPERSWTSWTAHPWQPPRYLTCPWEWRAAGLEPGRPALGSGVDLLCDFRMSHLASLGSISSSWEVGRIESGLRMRVCGRSQVQETLTGLRG